VQDFLHRGCTAIYAVAGERGGQGGEVCSPCTSTLTISTRTVKKRGERGGQLRLYEYDHGRKLAYGGTAWDVTFHKVFSASGEDSPTLQPREDQLL
jgi:hypothetical protein